MKNARQRVAGDDGSSLVLALLFLTVMSLLIGSLLTFGDTSFRATISAEDLRAKDVSAQGAVDAVINSDRGDLDRGAEGDTTCGSNVGSLNGFSSVTVTCSPRTGSGQGGSRLPKNAVLTLSTDPAEGIILDKNNTLFIRGAVYSHSSILLQGSSSSHSVLQVVGNITAEVAGAPGQDCNDSNIKIALGSSGTKQCGQTSPNGADPGYPAASPLSGVPATPALPTCSTRGGYKLATFQPGRYTLVSPTVLANTACAGSADGMLFSPGNYYLLDVAWDTDGRDVIAGTPSPTWFANPNTPPPSLADGACTIGQPGVQFIMGGGSYISLSNATRGGGIPTTFNLCAPPNASGPSIGLYGVKDGSQGFAPQSGTLITHPYTSAGGGSSPRATLFADNKPYVFMHGTVYAPLGALDLDLHNSAEEFFDRGVVARSLLFHLSASSTQSESPISLPACTVTPGDCHQDRSFVLTASVGGKAVLRTLVMLTDADGSVPGATVATPAWSVLR